MPTPTTTQLLAWARAYVDLWNAGDKPAWIENWRSVAPGDFRMLDPVGTPMKHGFEECCTNSFDLFQPTIRFEIAEGALFVCDNEVAWHLLNHFESPGGPKVGHSLETYQFGDDGSVLIRTYYRVPSHGDRDLGELFQEYLP